MQNMNSNINANDFDNDDEQTEEQPEEEQGYNYPTVYLDGTALGYEALPEPEMLERVAVEFDAASNGMQSEADERAPLGWVNNAAISLDRNDDSVTLSISIGDPRGAFTVTVRRLDNGEIIMHVPHPSETRLHMPLRQIHDGTYNVG